jgi:hypothetical protein
MLIIVNSLPKCGSTWLHNYIERCLVAAGHRCAQDALAGGTVAVNDRANPGDIGGENLAALLRAAATQSFAIKAHRPPNPGLLEALRRDRARTVFVIRHPAAAARSALDYGEFCRAQGWDEPYKDLRTLEQAADFIAPMVAWAEAWLACGIACVVRYEELFAGDDAIRAVAHRLMPDTAPVSLSVLESMRPQALSAQERAWLRVNRAAPAAPPAPGAALFADLARRLGYEAAAETPSVTQPPPPGVPRGFA